MKSRTESSVYVIANVATAVGNEPDPMPANGTATGATTVGSTAEIATVSESGFLALGLVLRPNQSCHSYPHPN